MDRTRVQRLWLAHLYDHAGNGDSQNLGGDHQHRLIHLDQDLCIGIQTTTDVQPDQKRQVKRIDQSRHPVEEMNHGLANRLR